MEKNIITTSYWLGILCVVLTFVTRACNILGVDFLHFGGQGSPVSYRSFLNGALLFLLTAIATGCYSSFNSQKRN
jgi:hypothetical protein